MDTDTNMNINKDTSMDIYMDKILIQTQVWEYTWIQYDGTSRDERRILSRGGPEISIFFFSNTHPYSINKLSTKTNT